MEENYAIIEYVELTNNILIPYEWPIQGIENVVFFLAKKIIVQSSDVTTILQVKNIPAKLIRRSTAKDSIYIFQKVPLEEVVGAYLYDVVLPFDDHSIKIDIPSGSTDSGKSWPNYIRSVSPRAMKISYHIMPPRIKKIVRHSVNAKDHALHRCVLRSIKRTSRVHKCRFCCG